MSFVLAADIILFTCFAESEQPNIGQSYRLCLLIEWKCSRWRKPSGVLGYPEKISVDNGQARTKIALVNAQCKKQPQPPKVIR